MTTNTSGTDLAEKEKDTPADQEHNKEEEHNAETSSTTTSEHNTIATLPSIRPSLTKHNALAHQPSYPKYEKLAQKNPKPMKHPSITFGPAVIALLDIVVPCIIYYTWYNIHASRWKRDCRDQYTSRGLACPIPKPEFDKDILGYAIVSFGFGELWILIARVYRLFYFRHDCAPLLSRSRWDLDATSWVYTVAMICALIPFVVGSTLQIPKLYLYSPSFLMGFLGILMVITLIPFKTPVGINSHRRGSGLRPFIYYAAEDFIAVDGLQDREFRFRYNARYESSKAFRRLFLYLTIWWIFGVLTYLSCVSAVIWTREFHYAFGLSLGVLFGYIAVWAVTTVVYVNWELARQKKSYDEKGWC